MSIPALKKLFREDQADREKLGSKFPTRAEFRWITERDRKRRKQTAELLRTARTRFNGRDFFMAALVFQHGPAVSDSRKAVSLAGESMRRGYRKARYLYAAAVDRLRLKQRKKQKYGTQSRRELGGKWKIAPVDPATTDAERKRYDVPPLAKIRKQVKVMNNASAPQSGEVFDAGGNKKCLSG